MPQIIAYRKERNEYCKHIGNEVFAFEKTGLICHNSKILNFNKSDDTLILFLKDLIKQAGAICIKEQSLLKPADVKFKNKKDLVTITDKRVEDFIVKKIRTKYPSHDVLGEETGKTNFSSDYLWIIDPIDGTTSFFHQQPFYSVSIALQYKGQTICGAVYAPRLDELFYADKDKGAFLNDCPINVSKTDRLINCVMATGFACLRANLKKNNLEYFNKIVPRLRDIRRYGSAAIDLCYVACGRLDGFWEMNLNIYDIAAGVFIVEQAGGKICDFKGELNFPEQGIVATNKYIQNNLLENFK
ncbi:inositol monophosphatase family protein [Desulfobacula toluolica]|uniref:Inositol-1-monophosphatase n=1 Tax=Desulfobacula toluolica (strain DSM 7467 / Tol2) TaxID=651182 RepID=K0NI82_DESTT|nr:inositol monophosphatase family protein [Desulfobacula toluolica]CCK81066.1 SuhB: inositol-1-monophosphatase [Desulfobacula toluolica Tol2]